MRDPSHRSCGVPPQTVSVAPRRWSFLLTLLLTLSFPTLALPSPAPEPPTVRVGLPLTLTDLYIPGGEARPKPRPNREPPLVIRLLAVKPAQNGRRYDLEVYGLDPGEYDLADFLEAVDPATPPQFPKLPLTITTELPPGLPRPGQLTTTTPKRVGGYKLALGIAAVLWILGLLALLLWNRKQTRPDSIPDAPLPLAERLRALLTAAAQRELSDDQKANLERLILGHWRSRLPELAGAPPAEALATLRHHEQAGPLLLQLEQWLHARESHLSPARIDELLAPYRD